MRTIIIDDNKQAVKDLNERLARFSEVEVVAVEHSGLDGLARVSELQPDLLFLDVQLPDISGLDFLDRLDFFTHGRCRVVMYTAYDEFAIRYGLIQDGIHRVWGGRQTEVLCLANIIFIISQAIRCRSQGFLYNFRSMNRHGFH
jgi:DNA-binding NarL/FixJ family response regulator